MKFISISFIFILFLSCSASTPKVKEKQIFTPLETFLLDYLKNNPNSLNNPTTINESSKILKKKITELLTQNDSIFYYNPLEFKSSFGDNKIFGRFDIFQKKILEDSVDDLYRKEMYVDVVMEIPKSQIDTMKVGQFYRVIGNIKRYIKQNDNEFNLSSWTFEPSMENDFVIKERVDFKLGCIYFKPKKIEVIIKSR
jgi:hypothetical protein